MYQDSIYGDHVKDRICELLMQGRSLRSICEKEEGMPAESTVRYWILKDLYPEFTAQYTRARDFQADRFADEVIEIADQSTYEDAAVSRLRFDARRWYVSKVLPKKYGDKLDVTTGGNAISTNVLGVLSQATLDAIERESSQKVQES